MTPSHKRALFVVAVSLAAGSFVIVHRSNDFTRASDLMGVRMGAAAFLQGLDPYRTVGTLGPYPLLYPLTALIVSSPLLLVPPWLMEGVFVFLGTMLLTVGLTRERLLSPPLVVLVSAPFLYAVALSQWSPVITGAALVPWAGFLLVCKPTIGLALFAAYPRRSAAVGGTLLVAVSVLLWPGWIEAWRRTVSEWPGAIAPVMLPGGPVLLLSLLKWRRPEARLLAALACVPHTTLAYEAVPLFLIPRTWNEAWAVWAGTAVAFIGHGLTGPYASQRAWVRGGGLLLLGCAYLPCLLMVLRRPNVPSSARAMTAVDEVSQYGAGGGAR